MENCEIVVVARKMASSGSFRGWRSIETHLRGRGEKNAKTAFDDPFLRRELDLTCRGSSIFDI